MKDISIRPAVGRGNPPKNPSKPAIRQPCVPSFADHLKDGRPAPAKDAADPPKTLGRTEQTMASEPSTGEVRPRPARMTFGRQLGLGAAIDIVRTADEKKIFPARELPRSSLPDSDEVMIAKPGQGTRDTCRTRHSAPKSQGVMEALKTVTSGEVEVATESTEHDVDMRSARHTDHPEPGPAASAPAVTPSFQAPVRQDDGAADILEQIKAPILSAAAAMAEKPLESSVHVLHLVLKPDNLGEVEVRLKRSGKSLLIAIDTAQKATHDLLRRDSEVLERSIGISISLDTTVVLSSRTPAELLSGESLASGAGYRQDPGEGSSRRNGQPPPPRKDNQASPVADVTPVTEHRASLRLHPAGTILL